MTLYPRAPAARRRGDGTAKTLEMTHFACELVPRSASAPLCVLAAPQPPESSSVPKRSDGADGGRQFPSPNQSGQLHQSPGPLLCRRRRATSAKRQVRVRINAADFHKSVPDKRVRESVNTRHHELNVSPEICGLKNDSRIRQGWDQRPDAARLGVLCVFE